MTKGAIESDSSFTWNASLQVLCLTLGAYGVRHFFVYFFGLFLMWRNHSKGLQQFFEPIDQGFERQHLANGE
jgi:hypothetical protein